MTRTDSDPDNAARHPLGKGDVGQLSVHSPITLGQFLKAARLVGTGGEAKTLIQTGAVRVNGKVELHRGPKLRSGDVVEVAGKKVRVGED